MAQTLDQIAGWGTNLRSKPSYVTKSQLNESVFLFKNRLKCRTKHVVLSTSGFTCALCFYWKLVQLSTCSERYRATVKSARFWLFNLDAHVILYSSHANIHTLFMFNWSSSKKQDAYKLTHTVELWNTSSFARDCLRNQVSFFCHYCHLVELPAKMFHHFTVIKQKGGTKKEH